MFRVSTLGRFALDDGRAKCPAPPSGGRSTTTALSRFSHDERGQVALTFGLLTIIMATFIGAAVDMGRWMQARKATQEAMDSAVLAGLKKYQDVSTASDAVAQAVAAAMANYKYNIAGRTPICAGCDTISFVLTNSNTSMESTGNVIFQMPFLGLVNMPTLPLLQRGPTQPGAEFSAERSVSKTAVGANTGTSLEISVMIDITGSMGQSDNAGSTKIETVKTAAKNLIDIVVWADQTQYTSKVAVVPFSETVNLGTAALADSARGAIAWGQTSTTIGSEYYKVQTGTNRGQPTYTTFRSSTKCVTERIGAERYTDASPLVAPVGDHYSPDGSCPTASAVMPLSNDKTALKNLIGSLSAGGATAGQMGTAWAWYMLSPNFKDLWPASSQARPYGDLTTLNSKGKPVLQKIAILMTDGDYNTEYCNGVNDGYLNCSPNNDWSQNQAMALCTAMKAKGITVYTIGAQVSSAAKSFLKSCSSGPTYYYDATDGAKLNQAFIDIAYKLVPPYLSH